MKILIIGAGGHAQVIADALLEREKNEDKVQIVGFLDDNISIIGKKIFDIPVLGKIEEYKSFEFDRIVVGIGDNKIRYRVFNQFQELGYQFLTVVHPKSIIASSVTIGDGTVIFAGVIINASSFIGSNTILNTGATIDHHSNIASHVHVAPGVHLGGTVSIGEGSFVGIGANIIPNSSIGVWSVIGAGATVISDIPSNVTAVGIPAKIIQKN